MAGPAPFPAAAEKYRKLPGRVSWLLWESRLWLGGDHLLAVSTMFGVERYRRFYFKEIEALVVQRTRRRLAWNAVFGGIAGLVAVIAVTLFLMAVNRQTGGVKWDGGIAKLNWSYAFTDAPGGSIGGFIPAIVFGGIAAFFLLLILINTLRGQTCALFIQTASGLVRLENPVRTRVARRLIAHLAPQIEAAQGGMTNGE